MTPEAAEFIERTIDTIQQLEILILLRQSSGRVWSVREIADEIQMSTATVASNVTALHSAGVLVAQPERDAYRYEPQSIALHAGVESLLAAYEADPLPVVKAVFEKPPRALRTFSDAFLFRPRRD